MTAEQAFQKAFVFALKWEGTTFEDDPDDPGGATRFGIIQSEYDLWRHRHGLSQQSVEHISPEEARTIYLQNYWRASSCPELAAISPAIAIAVFDTSVNLGVGRGTKWLQRAVGAAEDGQIGPKTLAAVSAAKPSAVVASIVKTRLDFRDARVKQNSTQRKFLKGWKNRDNDLGKFAMSVAG